MAARKQVDFAIEVQPPEMSPGQNSAPQYYNDSVVPPPIPHPESPTTESDISQSKDAASRRKIRREQLSSLTDHQLEYSVEEIPPWYICIILGFQHYLIMFGATVANPLIIAKELCIGEDYSLVSSELIGTIFFVCGICTIIQTTFGIRLPIVQGGSFSFVIPSLAILSLEKWKCPSVVRSTGGYNATATTLASTIDANGAPSYEEAWKPRIRELQGAIMVASIVQVIIGFTGVVGFLLRFIGPLAVAPTIALAGLSLFSVASEFAAKQWWIALLTIFLIATFSQYTEKINIPCFRFERGVGCVKEGFPLFRLFPVILAIAITWFISAILTATHVFPSDPKEWGAGAATNLRLDVMEKAPWFRLPYPGQWGTPTVSAPAVFGMFSGVLASMVESLGDYYACARMSQVPPPPMHAINRAIGIEGLGCILSGAWGFGSGTTSYSENIGAIGITKVASRRVIQVGAVIMMIFGVFGKFGAIFVTIPDPIIGGVFIVMFGMITAVGISNLQFVDLNSSRNLFVIGFSFFFGLTLPQYVKQNKNIIKTGTPALDQVITVLLQTNMFVGGMSGFLLDNTIPGSDRERGLVAWRSMLHSVTSQEVTSPDAHEERVKAIYDIPLITPYLRRSHWTRYVPFLPTFDENILSITRFWRQRKQKKRLAKEANATETI